jgi:hypothetical protein
MSIVKIQGDASGTGEFILASPNSNSNRTLTLPDATGTLDRTNRAGNVLQVVSTTKTDTASGSNLMSSGSWANVLQVSITPTSSSSKILIIYAIEFGGSLANGDSSVVSRLVRGSTAICIGDASGTRSRVTSGHRWPNGRADFYGTFSQNFLDSPATTSSTTYSVQLACRGVGSNTWYCNRSNDDYDTSEGSRSASTITVMEIAA